MTLHVHVFKTKNDKLRLVGEWEDRSKNWGEALIDRVEGQTAAETVELYFLERNMVASWLWSKGCCGNTYAIHGQFVTAGYQGSRAYKEVTDSLSHQFDL